MVKHLFVVGFLVAELLKLEIRKEESDVKPGSSSEDSYAVYPYLIPKSWEIQSFVDKTLEMHNFSAEQRLNAINISRSVAIAYVMDQKAMLLQQSSWQNNVRMNNLVEQIRGPLSSIRTLSKMLAATVKKNEIPYDIVEDIMVLGDHMKDTLQQLQDAVQVTKTNIVRYNEENLVKIDESMHESLRNQLSNVLSEDTSITTGREYGGPFSLSSKSKDLEMPMPPLTLAPLLSQDIRPCNASDVLSDLVDALLKQQRAVQISELPQSLEVAVEEPALRQDLSNLIEGALLRTNVGGMVEIVSTSAPAGGALIIIDDDGPDMHYMVSFVCVASPIITGSDCEGAGEQFCVTTLVWIDHCSFASSYDGVIDIVAASTNITIPICHFVKHDKALLFGASDETPEDKIIKVTLAYNHFGRGLTQRLPIVRFGFVHVVNNDYTEWPSYAIGGADGAIIISQGSQGNQFVAADGACKEITKREQVPETIWRKWTWRSEGDLLLNGAYFRQSGNPHLAKTYKGYPLIPALPATEVPNLTKSVGASLGCRL